jgi:hypothetical protein
LLLVLQESLNNDKPFLQIIFRELFGGAVLERTEGRLGLTKTKGFQGWSLDWMGLQNYTLESFE